MYRISLAGRPGPCFVAAIVLCALFIESVMLLSAPSAVAQEAEPVAPPAVTGEYVPPGATAVMVIHPRSLFSLRSMRLMPLEIVGVTGKQQLGVDPLQVEQLKVVIGEIGPAGPAIGAVVQMAPPENVLGIGDAWVRVEVPTTVDGKDFYPLDRTPNFVFHVTDPNAPQIALVGEQSFLLRMLEASGNEPPLSPLLEQLPPGDELSLVLAMEPIRPLLQPILDQQLQAAAPQLPDSVVQLRALPALIDHLRLRVNLGERINVELKLVAIDDPAGERLEALLKAAMEDIREAVVQQMEPNSQQDPEMAEAIRKFARRMSGEVLVALTPVRDGNELTIRLEEQFPHMALIGVMTGLTLPAIPSARGAARRMQSSNNLKQLALAMHNFHAAYGHCPAANVIDPDSGEKRSWRVEMLPFVEAADLYDQYRKDEPWDSEHNLKLVDKIPAVFRHPNSTAPGGHTVYQAVHGEEIGLRTEEPTPFRMFTDGLSNTIMFVEVEDEFAVPWTKPADVEIDQDDPWPPLGGHSEEGMNVAFYDGSVRLIPYWLEPETLWALMTRAGGEAVDSDFQRRR